MKLPSWMHRTPHDAVTPPPAPSCRLIVVEDGAQVVDAISGGDWEETVVIAEQKALEPLGLVEQVTARLRVLERELKQLQTAELVVSSCRTGAASATRRLVARALLARYACSIPDKRTRRTFLRDVPLHNAPRCLSLLPPRQAEPSTLRA